MTANTHVDITLPKVRKRLPAIRNFLSAAGAEILEPTNEYELLRFRAGGNVSIVYFNKRESMTMTGQAQGAINAFFGNGHWSAPGKTKRHKSPVDVRSLIKRDGPDCFACCWPIPDGEETVDHLVAVTHGGPNHLSNKVLMHRDCNEHCGHMSAPEKVRMHVAARMANAALK